MGCWSHIYIEGYCMFKSMSKKTWKVTKLLANMKTGKPWDMPNKGYIPKTEQPKWCRINNKKLLPQFKCLCSNESIKCPFFAYTEATKKDATLFDMVWNKFNKE